MSQAVTRQILLVVFEISQMNGALIDEKLSTDVRTAGRLVGDCEMQQPRQLRQWQVEAEPGQRIGKERSASTPPYHLLHFRSLKLVDLHNCREQVGTARTQHTAPESDEDGEKC
jgi:hypothetical protein